MSTLNPGAGLEQKLDEIGRLEDKHKLIGVSFAVKEGGAILLTEESVDYVIKAIEDGVAHINNRRQLACPVAVNPRN